MDYGGSQEGPLRSTDDQARLARVEKQLAALQEEVAQLKRRLTGPSETGDELGNERDSPDFSEVALTVFAAIEPVTSTGVVKATPVVVVHAPPELQEWARGRPDPLVRHADSLLAGVKKRLSEAVAGPIVDEWNQMNWQVTDFGGFAGAADLLGHLDSMAHRAVGAWLAELGRALGVPGPIASGAGAVIGYLVPLPIDRPLGIASLAIAITGVAVFTIVGGKVMVCASFKELVNKALTDLVAKDLRSMLSPAQLPEPQPTRDRRPAGPSPAGGPLAGPPGLQSAAPDKPETPAKPNRPKPEVQSFDP
jgi:hypothetical protein